MAFVVLAGCGLIPNDPAPADGPLPVADCEPPLAFEGETTIAELGLADAIPNVGGDAARLGMIRITRDTVTWAEFAPPDVQAAVPEGQVLCITWDDGSGLSTLLHRPFHGGIGAPADEGGSGEIPLTAIVVGLAVVLLVAVSWLSFRREAPPSAELPDD
jgi:hypothetical protein